MNIAHGALWFPQARSLSDATPIARGNTPLSGYSSTYNSGSAHSEWPLALDSETEARGFLYLFISSGRGRCLTLQGSVGRAAGAGADQRPFTSHSWHRATRPGPSFLKVSLRSGFNLKLLLALGRPKSSRQIAASLRFMVATGRRGAFGGYY
jgi:hypothetical protein